MLQALQSEPIVVSLGYILVTLLVAKISRLALLAAVKSKYYQSILLELVATFELCATVFELGVVMESQGFLVYTGIMLLLFNYWGTAFQGACAAPHPLVVDVFQGNTNVKFAGAKILAQIIAASSVYTFYVKPIWSLGFRTKHIERVWQLTCSTHLQVPLLWGIGVEALAALTFLTALRLFGPHKHNYVILPLVLVSIVYTGLHWTGAYFNPILATTIQFGCGGISALDHFLVYWIGPVIGAFVNLFTSRIISDSGIDKKIN